MSSKPIKVDLSNVWMKDVSREASIQTTFICESKQPKVNEGVESTTSFTESTESTNLTEQTKPTKPTKPTKTTKPTKKKTIKEKHVLKQIYKEEHCYEVGIDEAGRGPMFGRLYVAGVVLPKEGFDCSEIKDSKKFSSKKKIHEVYEHIKKHAIAYHVHYAEPQTIDKINIRQAVLNGMRECAKQIMDEINKKPYNVSEKYKHKYFLMVDGDDFKPITQFNEQTNTLEAIPHDTFVGGDHEYVAIAAASILAKVERDQYIADLCKSYPALVERYGMDTHMGYGTKKHLDGIKEHGITQFHRTSYGCCKQATLNVVEKVENKEGIE